MTENTGWPADLDGACYEPAHGWYRPVRQDSGRIAREPIPAGILRAAGVPEQPQLADGQRMLVLHSEPLRNLIPRQQR